MTYLTSSKTGTFYFAFGSNLSPYQMSQRCTDSPSSSEPIAIARLDGWKWIICQRGYANVVELPSGSPEASISAVWGIMYNMTAADEEILDHYEGYTEWRNPSPTLNPDVNSRSRKPFLQENWDYNKQYLEVTVTKWLSKKPAHFGCEGVEGERVTSLVYVDELRSREGTIVPAYEGRMNRAIDESVRLGVPRDWIERTMRKWVKPGIYPPDGYIGTDEGYIPDQETEASDLVPVTEVNGEVSN